MRYRFSAPHPPALPRQTGKGASRPLSSRLQPEAALRLLELHPFRRASAGSNRVNGSLTPAQSPVRCSLRCAPHAASSAAIDPVSALKTRLQAMAFGKRSAQRRRRGGVSDQARRAETRAAGLGAEHAERGPRHRRGNARILLRLRVNRQSGRTPAVGAIGTKTHPGFVV